MKVTNVFSLLNGNNIDKFKTAHRVDKFSLLDILMENSPQVVFVFLEDLILKIFFYEMFKPSS